MKYYNHGLAEKQFKADWKRQKAEYRKAGMSETAIAQMFEYEREVFKSERRYLEHYDDAEFLWEESSDDSNEEAKKAKMREKYIDVISVSMSETEDESSIAWVKEIEREDLFKVISSLNKEELELLTLFAMDDLAIAEIARQKGVAKQTIWKKIDRIKEKFKKIQN